MRCSCYISRGDDPYNYSMRHSQFRPPKHHHHHRGSTTSRSEGSGIYMLQKPGQEWPSHLCNNSRNRSSQRARSNQSLSDRNSSTDGRNSYLLITLKASHIKDDKGKDTSRRRGGSQPKNQFFRADSVSSSSSSTSSSYRKPIPSVTPADHTNERQTPIEILPAGPSPVRRPEEKRRSRRPTSAPGSRAEDRFFNELLVVPGRLQGQSVFIHLNTASTYSLISKHCAERCGLMKYLSRSTDIVVNGVEAIGHLHFCYVTLGDVTIEVSLIVVETLLHDIVLGLDTLKRHGFCIDLGRGELVIGRCGRSRSRRRPDSRVSRKKSFRKARTPVDDNLKRSSTPSHELKVWESGRQKARSDRRTPSKRRHSTFSRSEEKQIRRMIREEFPPNYAVPLVSSSRTGK